MTADIRRGSGAAQGDAPVRPPRSPRFGKGNMVSCRRCGVELAPGSLKYLVTIHVTADFDGVLPAEGGVEDLEAFMRQVDARDEGALEKDVYQSQGFVLCPNCKAAFLHDPLHSPDDRAGGDDEGRVH